MMRAHAVVPAAWLLLAGCPRADEPVDPTETSSSESAAPTATTGDTGSTGTTTLSTGATGSTATTGATSDTAAPCTLPGPVASVADMEVELWGRPDDQVGNDALAPGDLTGDGIADLVVGADHGGRVYVLAGGTPWSSGSIGDAAWAILDGGPGSALGSSMSVAGDVDGDGLLDLWIGDRGLEGQLGGAYLVTAAALQPGLNDLATVATARVLGSELFEGNAKVVGLGDLDDDGYHDVALTSQVIEDQRGVVHVLRGPFSGDHTTAEAWVTWRGVDPKDSLSRVVPLGDADGDGHADVALLVTGRRGGDGAVYFARGPLAEGEVRIDELPDELRGSPGGLFGKDLLFHDLDGDGGSELIIGAPYADRKKGRVYVVDSLPTGSHDIETAASGWWEGTFDEERVGFSVSTSGDLDGNGLEELMIGVKGDSTYALYGGASVVVDGLAVGAVPLTNKVFRLKVAGTETYDFLGKGVAAGDLTGDGKADLVVGANHRDAAGPNTGALYLHSCIP
jgi:hypothetical protein